MATVALEKRTWVCAEIGLTLRRCSHGCGPFKLLSEFSKHPGGVCRECRSVYKGRLRREGRVAYDRAYQARWRRGWVAANPERRRANQRRWYEKMMADPELHAMHREAARMAYKLKREREGVPLEQQRKVKARVMAKPDRLRLASRPLADFIDGLAAQGGSSIREICGRLGVSDRRLRLWRTGTERVSVEVAERVLLYADADWAQIWPPCDYPDLYYDGEFALG